MGKLNDSTRKFVKFVMGEFKRYLLLTLGIDIQIQFMDILLFSTSIRVVPDIESRQLKARNLYYLQL